jgi:hypothetical protein
MSVASGRRVGTHKRRRGRSSLVLERGYWGRIMERRRDDGDEQGNMPMLTALVDTAYSATFDNVQPNVRNCALLIILLDGCYPSLI